MDFCAHSKNPHANTINKKTIIVAIPTMRETAICLPAGNVDVSNSSGYLNHSPH